MQIVYFSQSSFSHLGSDRNLVKLPVAVVSESSDHSRIAALTCIDFVIKNFVIKKILFGVMIAPLSLDHLLYLS